MAYIIRFTNPQGAVSFYPANFGFGVHEHAASAETAERFANPATAQQRLNRYINPPAFWECERKHAALMQAKFRNWKCEVIAA